MTHPQSILPEEVWNLILNNVEDPLDILSCSHACSLFKSRLLPTTTTWAFPAVFPFLIKYLPNGDILHCRLVSKSWQRGIDHFMQSDQFAPTLVHHLGNHDVIGNILVTRLQKFKAQILLFANIEHEMRIGLRNNVRNGARNRENLNRFFNGQVRHLNLRAPGPRENRVQEFISTFGDNYEKNPFPSRSVVLVISEIDIEHILQFLEQFGTFIWTLGIVLKLTTLNETQIVRLILKLLNRVPNLKHLWIDESSGHINVANRQENVNDFVTTSTIPQVKHLKWIELNVSNVTLHDILVEAFGSRPVTIFGLEGGIKTAQVSKNWKRLTLAVQLGVASMGWDLHIKAFKHLHIPLESINIQYYECLDLKIIFENLAKYDLTLREVTLAFNDLKNEELIKMSKQVNSLYASFLTHMKCLQNFDLIMHCYNSTVEFNEFVGQILDKNMVEKYFKMGWVIRGFNKYGTACITTEPINKTRKLGH